MKKVLEKVKNDSIIKSIIAFQRTEYKDANLFLVGGTLRDFYLGYDNYDKDLVVENADAEAFARDLAKRLDATFISLDEENKIYRIVLKDKINCIDIASLIGTSIEQDLLRRDLTINSIAVNLKTLKIFDVNNGVNDLKLKVIRHISEQNFVDDPLRLLRVYRFQSLLGFSLDANLNYLIKKHAESINKPASERINYELLKLFSGNYCVEALENMDESGLLLELFPVIEELKKVPPNSHHHLNLFKHSIETVNQVQKIYEKNTSIVKSHLERFDFGGNSRLSHLKLAAFLHDIGKPSTWTIEEDTGKHRFIKHDDVGSKMCAKILKKDKFSKKQIDYIVKMIKYHIYPSHVVEVPELSEKVCMRFVRKMENEAIDVIVLAMADRFSAQGVEITKEIVNKNINNLQKLLDFYLNVKDSLKPLPKLLSGNDIMDMLNMKASKSLGIIIKQLQEAQLSGEVSNKKEAICFVKSIAKRESQNG